MTSPYWATIQGIPPYYYCLGVAPMDACCKASTRASTYEGVVWSLMSEFDSTIRLNRDFGSVPLTTVYLNFGVVGALPSCLNCSCESLPSCFFEPFPSFDLLWLDESLSPCFDCFCKWLSSCFVFCCGAVPSWFDGFCCKGSRTMWYRLPGTYNRQFTKPSLLEVLAAALTATAVAATPSSDICVFFSISDRDSCTPSLTVSPTDHTPEHNFSFLNDSHP